MHALVDKKKIRCLKHLSSDGAFLFCPRTCTRLTIPCVFVAHRGFCTSTGCTISLCQPHIKRSTISRPINTSSYHYFARSQASHCSDKQMLNYQSFTFTINDKQPSSSYTSARCTTSRRSISNSKDWHTLETTSILGSIR